MKPDIHLTLYRADTTGSAQNCVYRHEVHAENAEQLREAVRYDHVFAKFRDSRRSNANFEYAELLVLDCDNDHSDSRDDWIWPEDLAVMLPDVSFVTYSSRHSNMAKENRSPRPRFHVIFPIERIGDAETYAALKRKAAESLPFFDCNALDAGRFFFGVENAEVFFHPGEKLITGWLKAQEQADESPASVIPEGERNSTLFRAACDALKSFGDTQEAYDAFLAASGRCSPPLTPEETGSIWRNAHKYARIRQTQKTDLRSEQRKSVRPPEWEEPIPLEGPELPPFPLETLPPSIAAYIAAVSESLQIPPDMAAACALGVLSICLQKKAAVRINDDWLEPVNLFILVVADPSERKSPCIKQMNYPLLEYETRWNTEHGFEIETGRRYKNSLKRKVENLEKKVADGRASWEDLAAAIKEEQEFKALQALRLFLDDVTAEKLITHLAEYGGVCAIMSSEGGIFEILAGRYCGDSNFDVVLKGFSGDSLRVDRATRASETIDSPALTILLMVQPSVLSGVMGNKDFRGRGLTARFLYCIPKSRVGGRNKKPKTVPPEIRSRYEKLLFTLLRFNPENTREIRLSEEAETLRADYADEIEHRLKEEYADMQDWAGKIVGTTMRIAGLLCLADAAEHLPQAFESPETFPELVITKEQMQLALWIGSYFIEQAKAAYCRMGSVQLVELCKRALNAIRKQGYTELTLRTLMRLCRFLSTAEEAQKVLDHLESLGWLAVKDPETRSRPGRPGNPVYYVTPFLNQTKQLSATT